MLKIQKHIFFATIGFLIIFIEEKSIHLISWCSDLNIHHILMTSDIHFSL